MIGKIAWMVVCLAPGAPAQSVIATRAGLISYAEHGVFIDGRRVEISPAHPSFASENAVVRTGRGPAEVLLGPCTVMWVGAHSSFRLIANALSDTRVELLAGSAMVDAGEGEKDNKSTLLLQSAATVVDRKGVYRFDAAPAEVKVLSGRLTVEWAGRHTAVLSGSLLALDGSISARKFDRRDTDALFEWSRSRATAWANGNSTVRQQAKNAQEEQTASSADASIHGGATHPPGYDNRSVNGQSTLPPIMPQAACTLAGW